jgi:hypothetical protein
MRIFTVVAAMEIVITETTSLAPREADWDPPCPQIVPPSLPTNTGVVLYHAIAASSIEPVLVKAVVLNVDVAVEFEGFEAGTVGMCLVPDLYAAMK